MWGIILSTLTIALSLVGKKEQINEKVLTKYPILVDLYQADKTVFLLGAAFGIGCSLIYSITARQFRVIERTRLLWRYCWNLDESIILYPFREPSSITEVNNAGGIVERALEKIDDGVVRILVSPMTAATSTMHVSLVCIEKGREMPSFPAPAVEFYYVVSCPTTGSNFSQQGVTATKELKVGDFFVVDAGSIRWISNRGGSSPLIILRITDGGNRYNYPHSMERIRMDPTLKKNQSRSLGLSRITTMERLMDGWRHVQNIATKYVAGINIESGDDAYSSRTATQTS